MTIIRDWWDELWSTYLGIRANGRICRRCNRVLDINNSACKRLSILGIVVRVYTCSKCENEAFERFYSHVMNKFGKELL